MSSRSKATSVYRHRFGERPQVHNLLVPRGELGTQEALADGILDATQPRRRELTLPQDEGRKSYIALQQGKVARAVVEFKKQASSLGNLDTIGEITIGCALGYLDFRYANEPMGLWRTQPTFPSCFVMLLVRWPRY